jgi:hypothetical protein
MDDVTRLFVALPFIGCLVAFWYIGLRAAIKRKRAKPEDKAKWLRQFAIGLVGFAATWLVLFVFAALTSPHRQ